MSQYQRLQWESGTRNHRNQPLLSPLTCSGCHTPDCSIHCPSHGSEALRDLDQGQGLLETGNHQCSFDTLTGGGKNPGKKKENEVGIVLANPQQQANLCSLLYLLPRRRGVKRGLQPHLVRDDWLGLDLLHSDRLVEQRALVQG